MTDHSRALAIEGLRFFGEMSASVTHEIKNVLAIINENAGLLEDMVAMSERGMTLAPDRLAGLAQSIHRQVARGDRIVKTMNRFAHSADHATETVDVFELLEFLSDLAARLIALKGAAPLVEVPSYPVTTVTSRFFLENLVWHCLCRAMEACPPDQAVSIAAKTIDDTVRIRFHGLAVDSFANGATMISSQEAALCRMLNAQITTDEKKGEIILVLL